MAFGSFELKLLYENEKRLTFILNFDFGGKGSVSYTTVGPNGNNSEFLPPNSLRSVLQGDFISLLIFDGELAEQLLDSKSTNAQKAIDEMYQLTLFNRMETQIDSFYNDLASSANSKGSPRELSQRKNKVDNLKRRIKEVNDSKTATKKELTQVQAEIERLENEFNDEINKNTNNKIKIANAEAAHKEALTKLTDATKDLAEFIKNPSEISPRFGAAITSLKDHLDRVKLPGVAAREFFDELADESHCICGTEITPEISVQIKQNARNYLGAEEVGVLNAMKSDIKTRIIDVEQPVGIQLKVKVQEIKTLQDDESAAKQAIELIKDEASRDDPQAERIKHSLDGLRADAARLKIELEKYDNILDDSDTSLNLDILKRRLLNAEKELADATGTVTQKIKRDIVTRILKHAFELSRESLSRSVCEKINQKIAQLMPDNDIRVSSINRSLRLAGKDGGSVGETLTVGYAFLSSLLFNSAHQLPCVIDSPANPIDLQVRPQIAGLVPKISNQFIAFTISSERPGFFKPLMKACDNKVYLQTLFRKKNQDLIDKAIKEQNVKQTEDGILVEGFSFFDSFHSEDNE